MGTLYQDSPLVQLSTAIGERITIYELTLVSRCLLSLRSFALFKAEEVRVIFFDEPGISKAEVSILAYYDVVQDLNLHNIPGEDQVLGYLFVVIAGLRIPGRVVVDKD